MTPWCILDLALVVYVIGLLSLVGGGAMLFHAYMEDIEDEEATEPAKQVVPFPREYARTSCAPLGSRVRHERPRLRGLPGGRRSDV